MAVIECVPDDVKVVAQVAIELVTPATSVTGEQDNDVPLSVKHPDEKGRCEVHRTCSKLTLMIIQSYWIRI